MQLVVEIPHYNFIKSSSDQPYALSLFLHYFERKWYNLNKILNYVSTKNWLPDITKLLSDFCELKMVFDNEDFVWQHLKINWVYVLIIFTHFRSSENMSVFICFLKVLMVKTFAKAPKIHQLKIYYLSFLDFLSKINRPIFGSFSKTSHIFKVLALEKPPTF